MRQMSPMLQARIAKQQEINNSNKNNNVQQIDLTQKPDTVELSTKKNKNKKGKIFKLAAISAAILAAAAGVFIAAKKGLLGTNLERHANNLWNRIISVFKKAPARPKIQTTVGDESQKTVENIKKFISNGSEIEGVKLEKGKAVLADGSMFSGTMETVTKSGKKVAIDYENGFMTKSTINDKLFKTYEAPTENLERIKGALIREFDESGKAIKQHYHFLHNNGRLSKSMSKNIELNSRGHDTVNYNVLEFSPAGKKIAEYETRPDFCLEKGKIFNEDGSIKKEFKHTGDGSFTCDEKTYLPDGTSKEKINGRYVFSGIDEQIATKELIGCHELKLYDKDGKQTKWILAKNVESCQDGSFEVRYGDNLDSSIHVTDNAVNNLSKTPGRKNTITIDNKDSAAKPFIDAIHVKGDGKVSERNPHTKQELEKVVTILEDADKLAETEGMYVGRVLSDPSLTKSGFDKIIQQLKDYVSKLQ